MPHSVYHGFHQFSHSDFYYKSPNSEDPRAISKSWVIKTKEDVQFAESMGYEDSLLMRQFKKFIPGFEDDEGQLQSKGSATQSGRAARAFTTESSQEG